MLCLGLVCHLKFEVIISNHVFLAFRGFDNVNDYQLDEKPEEIRHSQGKLWSRDTMVHC